MEGLTLTLSAPARILPHETASSGLAPESDPSYYYQPIISVKVKRTHLLACIDIYRVIRTIPLSSQLVVRISYAISQQGDTQEQEGLTNNMAFAI